MKYLLNLFFCFQIIISASQSETKSTFTLHNKTSIPQIITLQFKTKHPDHFILKPNEIMKGSARLDLISATIYTLSIATTFDVTKCETNNYCFTLITESNRLHRTLRTRLIIHNENGR